nr:hypothetical protein [Tanacetum cinerariifolium]
HQLKFNSHKDAKTLMEAIEKRKGHFAKECRSPKDSRRNGAAEPQRRTRRSLPIMLLWLSHLRSFLLIMSFRVDAAMDLEEKHQLFNAAGAELSASKQKLMLLD